VTAAKRMIERSLEGFYLSPAKLIGDTAYGSAEMLNWLVQEQGIEPHIPVFDKSQRSDGTFSRDDFAYDRKRDCYICPAGKELRQRQKIYRMPRPLVDENAMMRYRAIKLDCECCPLSRGVVRTRPLVRSRAPSMKALAIWRATSRPLTPMSPQGANERRLRCCSPTSNASSSSIGCDCAGQMAPVTNSTSPPPPRTYVNSPC
jgi:hypothetical protein